MKKIVILCLLPSLLLSSCGIPGGTAADPAASTNTRQQSGGDSETQGRHDADIDKEALLESDIITIQERLFIAQTNDIYLNPEDYLGKTIRYEGLFKTLDWRDVEDEEEDMLYFVIRYGPGCCGYDGEAGFEVVWDSEWPAENDWVEAVGVLESYEVKGQKYLRLQLNSLTVLKERGRETVTT